MFSSLSEIEKYKHLNLRNILFLIWEMLSRGSAHCDKIFVKFEKHSSFNLKSILFWIWKILSMTIGCCPAHCDKMFFSFIPEIFYLQFARNILFWIWEMLSNGWCSAHCDKNIFSIWKVSYFSLQKAKVIKLNATNDWHKLRISSQSNFSPPVSQFFTCWNVEKPFW